MRLTVLGCWAPFPAPGGATSSYLLETEEVKVLVDVGSGAVANLLKWGQPEKLDAVILSHWHEDHVADLPILRYLARSLFFTGKRAEKIKLFYPEAPEKPDLAKYQEFFELIPIGEGEFFNLKGLGVWAVKNTHAVLSYGFKFTAMGKTFGYTGDTGYLKSHEEFFRGVDLLLAECTGLKQDTSFTQDNHLTTYDCANLAKNADVKTLVITHFWPFYEVLKLLGEVQEIYPGVLAAREGMVIL
ncbi:MBL fold metallo-hydrolase [Carboxydothermus pertinax]|uniref:MBL fold hydrolase n=1 Tax=Carboxydothermus pertinax TaxID=870242 RepID=A0A1L8CRU6_9THEO|nr:MBL fold metallo-hydrolase [Carboxydothermus pertinax]GAV21648.1 MBL fold hydrolase [Carboxydothermus pertinax]